MPGQHFHSYSTCAKGQTASIHAISLLEVCMEIPLVKDFSRAAERRRRLFVAVEFEIEKNKPLLFHVGDAAGLRLSFSLSAFVVARNFFCIQYISIFFYTGIYLILILTYSGYISYREHFLFFYPQILLPTYKNWEILRQRPRANRSCVTDITNDFLTSCPTCVSRKAL